MSEQLAVYHCERDAQRRACRLVRSIKRDELGNRMGTIPLPCRVAADFAYRANVDRSYMGGVERGERNLSFKKLCAIARTLRCDVGRLTRDLPID